MKNETKLQRMIRLLKTGTLQIFCKVQHIPFIAKGKAFREKCMEKQTYYLPFGIFLAHFILLIGRYLWSLYWVECTIISHNPIYLAAAILLPFLFWAMSTMCEAFNTHGWKKLIFSACVVHAAITLNQCIWEAAYRFMVIQIMQIRITETMTEMMVINLARIVLMISFVLPILAILKPLFGIIGDPGTKEIVENFKLDDVIDMRPNKSAAYDIAIMKEINGFGRKLPMQEQDLYTHIVLVGPSGTGKTSTSIIPAIIDLLNMKCKNRERRAVRLKKMLDEGSAYVAAPVSEISEYDIVAKAGHEDALNQIYLDYPDVGITCVSPNAGIGDAVVKLCGEADIKVNLVDPEKHYEQAVVKHLGINPFFIPSGLSEKDKIVRIIKNANSFSEILLAVNDASGAAGGDQYFKDLNTSVTSNIATIVMLYASLHDSCATLGVIQSCINDFSIMAPMCREINEKLGFGLEIADPKKIDKKSKRVKKDNDIDLEQLRKPYSEQEQGDYEDGGIAGKAGNNLIETLKNSLNIYRPMKIALQYVNDDLFMNGDKMYDQSRGLRNILNQMISHPDIFAILNAQENYVDFDRMLNQCEVTVVNSSLNVGGQKGSSALGLFYLLNHGNAVQRRDRDDRHPREAQPHFLITDESAQYLHSWMSQAVNLWRQYKCGCLLAFQTLSQMDRNTAYRDIKDSLLQVGNIIAYGRLGVTEMETFEKLSGTRDVTEYQETLTRSSILAEDPTANVGERRMHTEKANVTGSSARLKKFKEATWFRYVNGNVLPPLAVSLDFAKLDFFEGKGYKAQDWSVYDVPGQHGSGKEENGSCSEEETADLAENAAVADDKSRIPVTDTDTYAKEAEIFGQEAKEGLEEGEDEFFIL